MVPFRTIGALWRAALGTRSTGGYHVLIDLIEVSDGQMTVLVWEIRPGPRCGTTRALTHPFHANE